MNDPLITNIIVGLLSLASGWLITRTGKAGDREHKMIDQLQEELKEERTARQQETKEREKLSGRVDELSRSFNSMIAREAMYEFHISRQDVEIAKLGGKPLERPIMISKIYEGE